MGKNAVMRMPNTRASEIRASLILLLFADQGSEASA